jgi:uncharacterized protein
MQCPLCNSTLTARTVANVTLDVCESGCAGIWFDNYELKKFDEALEPDVETLLALKANPQIQVDRRKSHNCPKCKTIVMRKHFSSVKRNVEIEECGQCAGVWLDAGELTLIRKEFATEQERQAAADKLYSELLSSSLKEETSKNSAASGKAQRFANAFRFICPSYYIPGKQKGGAF